MLECASRLSTGIAGVFPRLLFCLCFAFACLDIADAERLRLIDFAQGQEFDKCIQALDWREKSAHDEVEVLDREPVSGCCYDGYVPGTQPLVRQEQSWEGLTPVLYFYGQVICGWRNDTYGTAGSQGVILGATCDYGTCYVLRQNFTCGDGQHPRLNGCCESGDYSIRGNVCRRSYFFEHSHGVMQDDEFLHISCKPETGPAWDGKPCEKLISQPACLTTLPGHPDLVGTGNVSDDIEDGVLQVQNLYTWPMCVDLPPTFTTTTSTNNETKTTTTTNATTTTTTNVTTTTTTTTVPTTTTNTSTTTTTNTTTTVTTTTTSTTTSTTTTDTLVFATGVCDLVMAVDDAVAYSASSVAEAAMREAVAEAAGEGSEPSMVNLTMSPVIKPYTGSRRLLGIVNVVCRITVPSLDLQTVLANLQSASLAQMGEAIASKLIAQKSRWLAASLSVQSLDASEVPTTTSTSTVTYTECPLNSTCFGHNCEECNYWFTTGHDCIRSQNPDGTCGCACEMPNGTTTREPKILVAGTVRLCGHLSVTAACAAVILLLTAACSDRPH